MIRPAAFVMYVVLLSGCTAEKPALGIDDAWARAPLPGRSTTAAYMTLTNNGDDTLIIDRISSPQYARIEAHVTEMSDGVMRMRQIAQLRLAPGETLTLAPGGTHLMLLESRNPQSQTGSVELSLFSGQQPLAQLTLPVTETSPYE